MNHRSHRFHPEVNGPHVQLVQLENRLIVMISGCLSASAVIPITRDTFRIIKPSPDSLNWMLYLGDFALDLDDHTAQGVIAAFPDLHVRKVSA